MTKIFDANRKKMVEFLSGAVVRTESIRKAFLNIKRENFVPESIKDHAYEDTAAPIWKGQTISQPTTIATMLELLLVKEGMKILEVGSGSGYVLALLSEITGKDGKVFGIEIVPELAETSKKILENQKINAEVKNGDGSLGWKENAPFDRIIISCACPFIPKDLFDQLSEDGRIVAPVGDQGTQLLEILIKKDGKPVKKTFEGGVFSFVPLIGKNSFPQK